MSTTVAELDDPDRALLPQKWQLVQEGDQKAIAWMVERYHWLPTRMARAKRVPPHFDREDVASWAYGGLFNAVRLFHPEANRDGKLHEHFIGYATLRINGAILDGMKAPGQSWATRDAWRKIKAMHEAEEILVQELGRLPTRLEVASHLGVAANDLPMLQQQVQLDAPHGDDDPQGPSFDVLPDHEHTDAVAEIQDLGLRLAAGISRLSAVDQQILVSLYLDGEDPKAIADRTTGTSDQVKRAKVTALLALRDVLQRS